MRTAEEKSRYLEEGYILFFNAIYYMNLDIADDKIVREK